MKTIVVLAIIAMSNLIAHSQESYGVDVTITINNVKNSEGFILLSLHNEETFMNKSKAPVQNLKKDIKGGKVKMVFKNVPEGVYAVIAVHDENSNNQMDFAVNGMPKEDYGTSNNIMTFGPPNFYDSKFNVTNENLNLKIRF